MAFAAGAILGSVGVWLLPGTGMVSERGGMREGSPASTPSHPARPASARSSSGDPPRSQHDEAAAAQAVQDLERRISELESDLEIANLEARRNLVRGALVFELDGRTPEEIRNRIHFVEPTRGTVRFSSNPEQITTMAWMYLHKIVPEDFEEALQRCLDHDLQWTDRCDLQLEEIRMVRDYTEEAYRLMVSVQQRKATAKRLMEANGALSPEERARLSRALDDLDDHRIYVRSFAPGFILPRLLPRESRGDEPAR